MLRIKTLVGNYTVFTMLGGNVSDPKWITLVYRSVKGLSSCSEEAINLREAGQNHIDICLKIRDKGKYLWITH